MKTFLKYLFTSAVLVCLVSGCINNDVPYPVIKAEIVNFKVKGQKGDANINTADRTVIVDLEDTVQMNNVEVLQFEVSDSASVSPQMTPYLDLSGPKQFTLSLYQDYVWTISATQTIDRYIEVENQVGSAVFDEHSKIVIVSVARTSDLGNMQIKSMKLGPQGAAVTPEISSVTDFRTSQEFTWSFKGRSETWRVKVVKTDVSIVTGDVNPFAQYVLASGEFQAGSGDPTFVYKKAGDSEWAVYEGEVSVNGGTFSAKIGGLQPVTQYLIKAKVGELYGVEVPFTTEAALQIENSNFDNWIKEGKSWFPALDLTPANFWWDSGNKGANTLGEKNPTVPEEVMVVKGKAAKLTSTSVVGVFAAGNIYTGKYVKTDGVGAQLDFGIPFGSRPTSLKGYYNYSPGAIDKVKEKFSHLKGQNDICNIYVALADWDAPFVINTTKEMFLDVNGDKHIIAYGLLEDGEGTNGQYREFEVKFEYRDLWRKPKYILIVAAASKYGDYFTGSTSSVLYVDEFTLSYE